MIRWLRRLFGFPITAEAIIYYSPLRRGRLSKAKGYSYSATAGLPEVTTRAERAARARENGGRSDIRCHRHGGVI